MLHGRAQARLQRAEATHRARRQAAARHDPQPSQRAVRDRQRRPVDQRGRDVRTGGGDVGHARFHRDRRRDGGILGHELAHITEGPRREGSDRGAGSQRARDRSRVAGPRRRTGRGWHRTVVPQSLYPDSGARRRRRRAPLRLSGGLRSRARRWTFRSGSASPGAAIDVRGIFRHAPVLGRAGRGRSRRGPRAARPGRPTGSKRSSRARASRPTPRQVGAKPRESAQAPARRPELPRGLRQIEPRRRIPSSRSTPRTAAGPRFTRRWRATPPIPRSDSSCSAARRRYCPSLAGASSSSVGSPRPRYRRASGSLLR